jgi:hypothetical protein
MRKWSAILLLFLVGCGAAEEVKEIKSEKFIPARPVTSIISDTVVGTVEGAWAAVLTPFEDIGVKKQSIPEKLQQIVDNPYALPQRPTTCESVQTEIVELDNLLGPDVCTPSNKIGFVGSSKGEYVEKGAGFARDHAVGMVSGKVNIIPFRGIVRRISGAEKHVKLVERSYQAGKLRRAFLKGLLVYGGCPK